MSLSRQYRAGELPDIQISNADVVKSVRTVCGRDEHLARLLLVHLCRAIGGEHDDFAGAMAAQVAEVTRAAAFTDQALAKTVFDLCQLFPSPGVDAERVVQGARQLQVQPVAILALERHFKAKEREGDAEPPAPKRKRRAQAQNGRAKEEEEACWHQLVELYSSIHDLDSARGLRVQFASAKSALYLGAQEEANGYWQSAYERYQEAVKKESASSPEGKLLQVTYLESMEKLSKWQEMHDRIKEHEIGNNPEVFFSDDGGGKRDALLQRYVRSCVHTLSEKADKPNGAFDLLKVAERGEDRREKLQRLHGLPQALLYFFKGKTTAAKISFDRSLKTFVEKWSSSSLASEANASELLLEMKRLSRLGSCLEAASRGGGEAWVERKSGVSPGTMRAAFTLQQADQLLADTRLCFRGLLSACPGVVDETAVRVAQVRAAHQLAREGLARNHYEVALTNISLSMADLRSSGEASLETSYQTIRFQAFVSKALQAQFVPVPTRINALYRTYLEVLKEKWDAEEGRARVEVLSALEQLVGEIERDERTEYSVQDVAKMLKKEKEEHFLKNFGRKATSLQQVRQVLLEQVVEVVQSRAEDRNSAADLFQLAKFCYQLWSQGQQTAEVASTLTASHVRAAVEGHLAALEEFPNLFEVLSALPEKGAAGVRKAFLREMERLASWRLLPWTNQLLASLSNPCLRQALLPFVRRMAQDYPAALMYPFKVSSASLPEEATGPLAGALEFGPLTARIFRGLSMVSMPTVKLTDFCMEQRNHLANKSAGSREIEAEYARMLQEFTSEDGDVGDIYRRTAAKIKLEGRTDGRGFSYPITTPFRSAFLEHLPANSQGRKKALNLFQSYMHRLGTKIWMTVW